MQDADRGTPLTVQVLRLLPATGGLSPSELWHLAPRPVGRTMYDHRVAVGRTLLGLRSRGLVERIAAARYVTTAAGRAFAAAGCSAPPPRKAADRVKL